MSEVLWRIGGCLAEALGLHTGAEHVDYDESSKSCACVLR